MIRERVPFDDLTPGDWITVWWRNFEGRVCRCSGAFVSLRCYQHVWYLQKTGRLGAIATRRITCVDVRRKAVQPHHQAPTSNDQEDEQP